MNIKVVILDRPNPLGGEYIEGRTIEKDVFSFVGEDTIPLRHGLTTGEFAKFINRNIDCQLEVVSLLDWDPRKMWSDYNRKWILTSPNLPQFENVLAYPGTVLFEATNVSEGRGTGLPFLFLGAPYIKSGEILVDYLKSMGIYEQERVFLRPCSFRPTSSKWKEQTCKGVQILFNKKEGLNMLELSLHLIKGFNLHSKEQFAWKEPGYEYNFNDLPIDLIIGTKNSYKHLFANEIEDSFFNSGLRKYIAQVEEFLLYKRDLKIVNFHR